VFIESLKIPKVPSEFPKLISLLLTLLAVILMLTAFKRREEKTKETVYNFYPVICVILCLIVYILVLRWIGYIVSSIVLIFSVILILGYKKKKRVFIISLASVTVIYLIFKIILGVPLPMGFIFN
jgi:asparagine N-glycosylation enzyme membrane subunit Stt3